MKKRLPGSPRSASSGTTLPVLRDEQTKVDKVRFPELADLMAELHFSTSDGRIWLNDQRMLLVHAKALGSMRREMIELLGMEVARGLFTRMGYQAGAYDAQMARTGALQDLVERHVRGRAPDALPGRHRPVRTRAARIRCRAGTTLWRVRVDSPSRGRRACPLLPDRHRALVLDAGGLCVRLLQRVHGAPDPLSRSRVPVDGTAQLVASSACRSRRGAKRGRAICST